jgi:peptidoglycan/LPS O-acetylase OafA/YrhL
MRNLPLESLRGISAVLIVMLHFKNDSIWHKNYLILNSEVFVDFFFILSGFVLCMKYKDNINSKNNFFLFVKKRFLRIYPLHILTLFFFVIYNIIKIYLINKLNLVPTHNTYNLLDFFKNIFLIHGISGSSYNLPSWSISVEFVCYLIFGLLVLKNLLLKLLFPIFIFSFVVIYFQITDLMSKEYMNMIRCLFCFFLGCLSFHYKEYLIKKNFSNIIFIISLLIAILFILFHKNFIFLIVPFFFSIIIISAYSLDTKSTLFKILTIKPIIFLGKISYSIYMIHFAVTILLRHLLHYYFNYEIKDGYLIVGNLQGLLFYLLIFFICLSLSYLSHKYFESIWQIRHYNEYKK